MYCVKYNLGYILSHENFNKNMENKIVRLRNLLNRNKVFFEVLAATVLTITSVFVSFQANAIANQANNISKIQTAIMEKENTPNIEIRKTQLNKNYKIDDNITEWKVLNNNSKVSNFEIERQLAYLNIAKRKNSEEVNIPLIEYINIEGKSTSESEGVIFEFDNFNCSKDEFLTREKMWDYGYVYITSYIEISYDDVLKRKETKYYQITPLIQEISKSEWNKILKDWSNKSKDAMHLKYVDQNIQKIKLHK